MLRNYLAAALRNLVHNKLYATINIVGLAVGFAAALLIALFVRNEITYDTWIPDHARVYRLSFGLNLPGQGFAPWEYTPGKIGPWFAEDFPEAEAVARLSRPRPENKRSVRRGATEDAELVYWADPAFASIIPFPAIAGDFAAALAAPDTVVLTRAMARKYFGRDNPLGESLELDRNQVMTVGAVIADLPANSHFASEIIGSGVSAMSDLTKYDAGGLRGGETYTYVKLKPGVSPAAVIARLPQFLDVRMPPPSGAPPSLNAAASALTLVPVTDIHLRPAGIGPMKTPGNRDVVFAMIVVAVLIVAVAAINFVNLMTARAARRATEVGVRKAVGGSRVHLIVQFLGESGGIALLAILLALAAATLSLPALNGALGQALGASSLGQPAMLFGILVMALITGVGAGSYPAFVLSAFRPARVLKGAVHGAGAGRLRAVLVAAQFAVLILMLVVTAVVSRQTDFALKEGLRFNRNQTLLIQTSCTGAFRTEVAKLSGVLATTCSAGFLKGFEAGGIMGISANGTTFAVMRNYVDADFFAFHDIQPLAGRLFAAGSPAPTVVINAAAARALGWATPRDAVGQTFRSLKDEIIGVVPDFQMKSLREEIVPMIYSIGTPAQFNLLHVSLAGDRVPDTVQAIDGLWSQLGDKQRPIARFFFDQYLNALYADTERQGNLFAAFAGVAIFLACLGLFGLSAFTAEQRTKEIGVRKAMGARTSDVLRLLIWQFVRPVLWANLVAWPVGYFAARRWLEGFAYHVELGLEPFLAASAFALVIAVVTVAGHALLVARAQPVTALRYE